MPSKELYIGNVDPDTKPQEIRDIFELYGTVNRCEVKFGSITHSAAFGFVGFESSEDAELAQRQENGRSLRGRRLIVQFTKTKAGQNLRHDRFIGLVRTADRNNNDRDRSRSRKRDDSRDRYRPRRRRRSPSYSRTSRRDRSGSNDRHRKRDRSRSKSNQTSSSKRLRESSKDAKHHTSHSHKNGNSKNIDYHTI